MLVRFAVERGALRGEVERAAIRNDGVDVLHETHEHDEQHCGGHLFSDARSRAEAERGDFGGDVRPQLAAVAEEAVRRDVVRLTPQFRVVVHAVQIVQHDRAFGDVAAAERRPRCRLVGQRKRRRRPKA